MRSPANTVINVVVLGFACTLVLTSDAVRLDARRMPSAIATSEQGTAAPYYPPRGKEWARKTPAEVGMSAQLLEEAMTLAKASETKEFSRDPRQYIVDRTTKEGSGEPLGPFRERAPINAVVVRKGYIVAEFGETDRPDMTFSVAKSFVSTTVGLAFDAGLIKDMNDPVKNYVKDGGYDSAHNAPITWQQTLQQTSEWEGTLWDKPDTADRRRGRDRQIQTPGTFWEYNDVRVNRAALSSLMVWKRPLPEVLKEKLMDPIGATNTWEWHGYRNSDVVIDGKKIKSVSGGGHWGGGVWISSHDLARFGYLFLRNGRWNGKQLISERWINMATAPTDLNPSYGYMWWLNTAQKQWPGVPTPAFAALGAGSNICFVDREDDLVVVLRWVNGRQSDEILRKIVGSITTRGTASQVN